MLSPAFAGDVTVTDGDTLKIDGERFRLWGIDAPELDQLCEWRGQPLDCGGAARNELIKLTQGQSVTCEAVGKPDRYGRTVARCSASGVDLGAAMVRSGWALDYRKYSHGAYIDDQEQARKNNRGLWWDGSSSTPPWEWRHERQP